MRYLLSGALEALQDVCIISKLDVPYDLYQQHRFDKVGQSYRTELTGTKRPES